MSEQRGWRYEVPIKFKPPIAFGPRNIDPRPCRYCQKVYKPVAANQIHCQAHECAKAHVRALNAKRKARAKRRANG